MFKNPEVLDDMSSWWNDQPAAREIPFLHTDLLRCWIAAFLPPDRQPHIRLLYRDGEPVAALPMHKVGGGLRSLSDHSDPFDLVKEPGSDTTEYLPHWLNRCGVAHFFKIREDSVLAKETRSQRQWIVNRVRTSPYVDLSNGIDAARSMWSKNHRRSLRRRWRRLEELGEVTYVDHPSYEERKRTLDRGLQLEAEGWKGAQGVAVLSRENHTAWYRSLADVADRHGWLRLSALYLDGRMIAFGLDLAYGDERFSLLTSYDESSEFTRLSVGNLLLDRMLEVSAAEGMNSYRLGHGSRDSKSHWTDQSNTIYDISVYGTGPRGRARYISRSLRAKSRSSTSSNGGD